MRQALTLAVALGALVATARADEALYDGQAQVRMTGDRVRARERALDEALRSALTMAANAYFGDEAMKAKASDLKLRVLPKAKAYVVSYRIVSEDEDGGMLTLRLVADVRLADLARDLSGAAPQVATPTAPQGPMGVCVTTGTAAQAGRIIERLAIVKVMAKLAQPDGACPTTWPADKYLLMVEIDVQPAGGVRGTQLVGSKARIAARLARGGNVEASPVSERFGWAEATAGQAAADGAALGAAADELGVKLVPLVGVRSTATMPLVEIRLQWKRAWSDVAAMQKALSTVAGVDRAVLKSLSAEACVVEVEGTLNAGALLSALERLPGLEAKGKVVSGTVLEVEITRRPVAPEGNGS